MLVAAAIGAAASAVLGSLTGYDHPKAFAICVVVVVAPATLVVLADPWAKRKLGPLVSYAAGFGLRAGVAFGGAGLAFALKVVPKPAIWFWGWFLASYLVALVCETAALVRVSSKQSG